MPVNDRQIAVTIGWELEATRAPSAVPNGVEECHDGSVRGEGREYRVSRSHINRLQDSINALTALATDTRLNVDRSCGFHVHVGIPSLGLEQKKQWALFFYELGRRVQETAFLAVPESRRNNRYCMRLEPRRAVGYYDTMSAPNRYYWLNVSNLFIRGEIETVEIRLLGSTRRAPYLLGWLGACSAMGRSAYRLTLDPTRLEIETEYITGLFQTVRDDLSNQTRITEAQWTRANELLQAGGIPAPSTRATATTTEPAPAPVRRARYQRVDRPAPAPVAPLEISEEIIRQAMEQFTIVPVGA